MDFTLCLCSTSSSCLAPVNPPPPNDVNEDRAVEEQNDAAQAVEKEKADIKCKTKFQTEHDNNLDKIYKIAQVENHPVDLALTTIAKQMIRTLARWAR